MSKRVKIFLWSMIIFTVAFIFCYWQNNWVGMTKITYKNNKIPDTFSGYKIMQVSDLHNKEFGKHQKRIIALIKKANPDIIVITGDLIDSRHNSVETAAEFVRQATDIAPAYYVSGNHEMWVGNAYDELINCLQSYKVNILDDRAVTLENQSQKINLMGVRDPDFFLYKKEGAPISQTIKQLKAEAENDFTILLSHRPELIELYAENNIDLVLTGHAHGGQFRFFGLSLIAPNQGFLPKYTSGRYEKSDTSMIVSRGLGNSIIPQRILNCPELVLVTLY